MILVDITTQLMFVFLFAWMTSIATGAAYTLNTAATGAIFEGIGAISGGGGETVLLPAYPPDSRDKILDLLFKPNFGASLHILKVEIGGDALSTDGSEPSHMHREDEEPNFSRGYEWWMMEEAKRRNQDVKLYGLPWEFPSWVGAGTLDPFTNLSKPLHYVTEWLRGADQKQLHMDYLGIWNERQCNVDYVLALRKVLDQGGHENTKIIAPDGAVKSANKLIAAMASNPALAEAVHAVGYHYPNSNPQAPANATLFLRTLRLWASEDDSTVDPPANAPNTPRPRKQPGGGCLIRTLNQNWIEGNMTATIVWNLVMARYPQLRWDFTGLIAATTPFGSGEFDILPPLWAMAHTTQFTRPGWELLRVSSSSKLDRGESERQHGSRSSGSSGSSGSGWLAGGGTYVTYVDREERELTIVIEKMDANESNCERGSRPADQVRSVTPENATFVLMDGNLLLSSEVTTLAAWSSKFGGEELDAHLFQKMDDVMLTRWKNGTITLELELLPNFAYTVTTVRNGTKGGVATKRDGAKEEVSGPAVDNMFPATLPATFPATYVNHFDDCAASSMPMYLAPMAGAFECVTSSGGRNGMSVRQTAPAMSICDRGDVLPYAILGDGFRTEYNITVDVLLPLATTSGGAFVGARCKGPVGSGVGMDGVYFAVNASGGWQMALQISALIDGKNDSHSSHGNTSRVVATGLLLPEDGGCGHLWCELSLVVSKTIATASINGIVVAHEIKIPTPYDHFTAEVAGDVVNLGKGGYASIGTVGYSAVEFDALRIDSR